MAQIPPINDGYIDDIIKAQDVYNPGLNKTQGIKLRELIKLLRDRLEQETAQLLDSKVDKQSGYQLSQENYSTEEKSKLASLREHFRGYYISVEALTAAVSAGTAGDYAFVDQGPDTDAQMYVWDTSGNKWVASAGGSNVLDTVLTGIDFDSIAKVLATDNILTAFGKLQAQLDNLFKIPAGGTAGQVLTKIDNADGNLHWANNGGGHAGASKVYNVEDYGAIHDGVTDDTAAIQSAINAAHGAGGGVVYFPVGIYKVDGALSDGNQISIPFDAYDDSSSLTRLKLLGEIAPNMFTDPLAGGPPPNTGAIIKSGLIGAGNIIGSEYGLGRSFTHLEINSITVRARSKNGGVDIAPEATAINAVNMAYLTMDSVAIDTESNRSKTVQPLATASGVILPNTDNYVFVNIDRVLVTGYYTGFETWECASLTNVFVDGCYYGISLNTTNHPAFFSRLFISRCAIDIIVRGAIPFFIDHYGFETMDYGWSANQYNLQETVRGAWGYIKYNKVISGVGHDNDIFVRSSYGASGVKVESINYSAQTETLNIQTASYTIAPLDREKTIIMDSSTHVNVTMPNSISAYVPVGAKVKIIQKGLGVINLIPGFGVTFLSLQDFNVTSGKGAVVELLQIDLNVWHLSGDMNATYTDSSDYAAEFVTATGITDSAQISALGTLVTDLRLAGLWDKIIILYPFLGSTPLQHSYNLKDKATYQLSFSGAGTHDANGYHPNGTDAYADTGLIPSLILERNSVHLCFYGMTDIGPSTGIFMGSYDISVPTGIVLRPKYTDGNNYIEIHSADAHNPIPASNGLMLLNRNSPALDSFDRNGNLVSTQNRTSLGVSPFPVVIGALNRSGLIDNFSSQDCGFAAMGLGLTDTERDDYNTIVQAFLTAIGR